MKIPLNLNSVIVRFEGCNLFELPMFTMRCATITGTHFYVNIRLHDYAIRQLEQQIKELQSQDKIQALKDSISYNEKLELIEKPYFTGCLKIIVLK